MPVIPINFGRMEISGINKSPFCVQARKNALPQTQSKISVKYISLKFGLIKEIIFTGVPSLARQGLNSISNMVLNLQAAVYGDGVKHNIKNTACSQSEHGKRCHTLIPQNIVHYTACCHRHSDLCSATVQEAA